MFCRWVATIYFYRRWDNSGMTIFIIDRKKWLHRKVKPFCIFFALRVGVYYPDTKPFSNWLWAFPDNKVHGANMWPTWVLSAPNGPHVGPMNLAIRIAKFMGPTWGSPGSCRPQMGPMLAPWTLLSGLACLFRCLLYHNKATYFLRNELVYSKGSHCI